MSFIPQELSMLVSSDPGQGARNVSSDGSSFEIALEGDGIFIPREALNVRLSVEEATVWWTVPNIITGTNDTMYIYGDDDTLPVPVPQLFTVVIPQGLYDLSGLNQAVQSGLEALGARTLDAGSNPLPLISFAEDTATNKAVIRFNYTNVTVDFTQADTPRTILGFNSAVYGPYAGAPLNVTAPNVAQFNVVNSFLIKSDLVSQGLRFNNAYNQIISQVLIDVTPGSQIVSKPYHPAKTDAQGLAGVRRRNLRFSLTDESNNPVNTNSEFWTARLLITYLLPYVIQ